MSVWERIVGYANKQERLVIGLMSGTSADGTDAALVRLSGSGRETSAAIVAFATMPHPGELRKRILALSHGEGNAEEVSQASVAVARQFAVTALTLLKTACVQPSDVDAIGSHGQTISHTPNAPDRATLQIGTPAVIAARTGIPVVSDFRTADVAVGGQGAPLTPYVDWCLLTHETKTRAIQNIGGIGNITYLPANAAPEQVLGFDTGPGNMLIDLAASFATDGGMTFDVDGQLAEKGELDCDLLEWLLSHSFLHQSPPKSAGREEFGQTFWQSLLTRYYSTFGNNPLAKARRASFLDPVSGKRIQAGKNLVTTLTYFTAYSIVNAYHEFLPVMPDEIIVGGGGARNPTLMRLLTNQFSPIRVITHDELGKNSASREALAFAVLANETLLGRPANLPSVTGAKRPVLLGSITLPP